MTPRQSVYSVSEITREIKIALEQSFPSVWVEGEVSNVKRHTSGQLYFSLKDPESQIACVMWKGRNEHLHFLLQDGMKVLIFGDVTVYERQGKYQLDVVRIHPSGLGALQQAFEALKQRLDQEGLFRPEHKKPLPLFPERIGVVTSPSGAALKDIASVVRRRFPSVELVVRPVSVQGETAAQEIAEAIREFNAYGKVDVLIVGRGGGSMEDLWAFNEEIVARAVYDSRIPVVSAVGHEIDFSICDFVADVRAPTPSASAELVVRDKGELLGVLRQAGQRMARSLSERLKRSWERLNTLERSYAFRRPLDRIREFRQRTDEWAKRLDIQTLQGVETRAADVRRMREKMGALSPEAVLGRGYSITMKVADGRIVSQSTDVRIEEIVRIRLSQGSVKGQIQEIEDLEP
jgi:exodeoxyribonuclease VII large subunit